MQNQGLAPARRELQNTKIKGPGQEDSLPTNDKALTNLLPQKKIADQLVQIYVDNLESTYRVLHLPSFWVEYSDFWKAPQEGRPAFAALLLLILASTYCLKERESSLFRGDSSVGRETTIMWIRTCDSWYVFSKSMFSLLSLIISPEICLGIIQSPDVFRGSLYLVKKAKLTPKPQTG